jgi:hypothetical protein
MDPEEDSSKEETLKDLAPGDWTPEIHLLIVIGKDSDLDAAYMRDSLENVGIHVSDKFVGSEWVTIIRCEQVASLPPDMQWITYVSGHCLDLEGREDIWNTVREFMGDGTQVEDQLLTIAENFVMDTTYDG